MKETPKNPKTTKCDCERYEICPVCFPSLFESQEESDTAPVSLCCDQAVREAGFATEPHRELIGRAVNLIQDAVNHWEDPLFKTNGNQYLRDARKFLYGPGRSEG